MDILLNLVELLRYLRQHDKAIALLETEIQEEFFTKKDEILKVIDELIKTLLRTEDFVKLKSVLFTRERFLTNEHQKVMQKFYLAVCHEGLREYKQAIDNLMSIKDNISSSNLVSKYLKLSMLHLKIENVTKTKEYFQIAIKFDYKRTNPICYLAESDILYAERDYINSLEKYQEYFIKSKNTRRYLDRYILLNIKLNRLDEAWRFYQEYLPTMKNLVSRNYRIIFYEAGKVLAHKLKNPFEEDKLEYLIQELQTTQPVLNQFDNVYRLLTLVFQDKRYVKERDIIHDMFKAIDSLYKFQKLLYVKKEDGIQTIYHYSKGLLLEKNPKTTELLGTILDTIFMNKSVNDLYGFDDLVQYSKELYKTVETQYVFANGIERNNSYDYFIVYSKDLDNFDFQQKLILIANEIFKKQLNDYDANSEILSLFKNYRNLFDQEQIGFIKIEKGILHFLNARAKDILKLHMDYLAFEEFQTMIEESIFLDDLLYQKEKIITIKNSQSKQVCQLNIIKDEYIIYITIKEMNDSKSRTNQNPFLNLPNEYQLLNDLHTCSSKNIIYVEILNYLDFFKDYSTDKYDTMIYDFIQQTKATAKQHFESIYMQSFNGLYIVINSIDKRVVKRIIDSILKIDSELEIRISVIQVNTTFTNENLIKLRHLVAITSKENPYIFDNKNFRYNQELAKTLLLNINSLIAKKEIPLAFVGVGDWRTDSIASFKLEISSKAMLGEQNSLNRVLHSASLEKDWDYLIATQLVKEIKKIEVDYAYIIDISNETLEDVKSLKKLVRKFETAQKDFGIFHICIDISHLELNDIVLENLYFLKEKGFMLVANNILNKLNVQDLPGFNVFDYVILNIEELKLKALEKMMFIFNDYQVKVILNHQNHTLKKSELEYFKIEYVYGLKYGKYESGTIANLGRS